MTTTTRPEGLTAGGPIRGARRSADRHAHLREIAAPAGGHDSAFELFVDEHRHVFRDYVARRLHGTSQTQSTEDVLQDALARIWRQFDRWPSDEKTRMRFARQALHGAVVDTFRAALGRDGKRARVLPADPAVLEGNLEDPDAFAYAIGHAIAREAIGQRDYQGVLERGVLIAAIAALSEEEKRVLMLTAEGYDCAEIATALKITHQRARTALMQARKLTRSLIEHAEAGRLSAEETRRLWALRDGKLTGRARRDAKRHLEHCAVCQSAAAIEQHLDRAAAALVLPLPALPALAAAAHGHGPAAHPADGAAHHGDAARSASGHGHLAAGHSLASATPTGWGGTLLAGTTAKVAIALGVMAVTGSLAGTYKAIHDADRHHQPATLVFQAAVPIHPPAFVAAHPALVPRAHRAPRRHHVTRHHRVHHPRTPQVQVAPAPQLASTAARTAPPASVVATVARTSPVTHVAAAAPPRSTMARSSNGAGGEFILGSR